MKIVKFFNWTKQDFTWSWDRVPHTFKAGESLMLEDWKANHFAKHLIDRELHREGLQVSDEKREEYIKRTVIDTDLEVSSQVEADTVVLNSKNAEISSDFSPMAIPPKPEEVTTPRGKASHKKKDETPSQA